MCLLKTVTLNAQKDEKRAFAAIMYISNDCIANMGDVPFQVWLIYKPFITQYETEGSCILNIFMTEK